MGIMIILLRFLLNERKKDFRRSSVLAGLPVAPLLHDGVKV
jgi:hypothetical protein